MAAILRATLTYTVDVRLTDEGLLSTSELQEAFRNAAIKVLQKDDLCGYRLASIGQDFERLEVKAFATEE